MPSSSTRYEDHSSSFHKLGFEYVMGVPFFVRSSPLITWWSYFLCFIYLSTYCHLHISFYFVGVIIFRVAITIGSSALRMLTNVGVMKKTRLLLSISTVHFAVLKTTVIYHYDQKKKHFTEIFCDIPLN